MIWRHRNLPGACGDCRKVHKEALEAGTTESFRIVCPIGDEGRGCAASPLRLGPIGVPKGDATSQEQDGRGLGPDPSMPCICLGAGEDQAGAATMLGKPLHPQASLASIGWVEPDAARPDGLQSVLR